MTDPAPVRTFEELANAVRDAPPPTPDDVPITWDGRRLDSREKVLSFLAELDAARSTGHTVGPLLSYLGEFSPERLVTALDRHGVEYLVVGGVAARAYGASRETKDFDCLVRRVRDNLDRLAAAMRERRAPSADRRVNPERPRDLHMEH